MSTMYTISVETRLDAVLEHSFSYWTPKGQVTKPPGEVMTLVVRIKFCAFAAPFACCGAFSINNITSSLFYIDNKGQINTLYGGHSHFPLSTKDALYERSGKVFGKVLYGLTHGLSATDLKDLNITEIKLYEGSSELMNIPRNHSPTYLNIDAFSHKSLCIFVDGNVAPDPRFMIPYHFTDFVEAYNKHQPYPNRHIFESPIRVQNGRYENWEESHQLRTFIFNVTEGRALNRLVDTDALKTNPEFFNPKPKEEIKNDVTINPPPETVRVRDAEERVLEQSTNSAG